MDTPILDVKNLIVDFGGVRAVNDISFSLRPGEFVGLIGPNGAGKTTVFNLITNSIRATSGNILFKEESILGKKPGQDLPPWHQPHLPEYSALSANDSLRKCRVGLA